MPVLGGSAIALKLQSFHVFMRVHESSWMFMFDDFKDSWMFMFSWFHDFMTSWSEPQLPLRRPFNVSSWSLSLPRHSWFFGSCNTSSFRHAKNCCRRDGLLRARDPNAFALPRIVERSHRPAFIVYHTSSSCNFAFKQRVHVLIFVFQFFRCHGFIERSVVTLATPFLKQRAQDQTHLRNNAS